MTSRPFISWLEILIFAGSIAVGLSMLFIAFAIYAGKNRGSVGGFEVKVLNAREQERHWGRQMAERDESTLDTILHLKRHEPFTPFHIVLPSGDRYLIENPDALAINSSQLHYYPRSGMGIHLRLNQIAAVEESGEKLSA